MASVAIAVGVSVGVSLLSKALTPKPTATNQLDDLSVLKSEYGVPIPRVWGRARVTGNVVWANPILEIPSSSGNLLRYFATFATMLCEGEIEGIGKVWLNNRLVYNPESSDPEVVDASNDFFNDYMTLFTGSDTQNPSPIIEGFEGVGNTPAFRGRAYLTWLNLRLRRYGEQVPKVEVEIIERNSTITLSALLNDLCLLAGLDPSQFSVNLTTNFEIKGFIFKNDGQTVRSAIEELQNIYPFQAIDDGNTIIFQDQEQPLTNLATLDDLTLATREFGQPAPTQVKEVLEKKEDLPATIEIEFSNIENDYLRGVQTSYKSTARHTNDLNFKTSLALTDSEVQTAATRLIENYWVQSKQYQEIKLPVEYMALTAGDTVQIQVRDQLRTAQVVKVVRGTNFIVEAELLVSPGDLTQITDTSLLESFYNPQESIIVVGNPIVDVLDPNLVDDDDNEVGVYVIAKQADPTRTWNSGSIYQSTDGGNFNEVLFIGAPAANGTLQSNLPPQRNGVVIDDYVFTVEIPYGELESVTENEFRAFNNVLHIQGELIAFKNANLVATNTYEIDTYVRGIRGSENNIDPHVIGETVHLVRGTGSTSDLPLSQAATLFQNLSFKAVPPDFEEQAVTNTTDLVPFTGNRLRPYAPTNLTIEKVSATNDLILRWQRRTRLMGQWSGVTEIVPLNEASELYTIELYTADGITLVETYNNITSPEFNLTSSEQITQLGSLQSGLFVIIYQESSVVGRGYPLNPGLTQARKVS